MRRATVIASALALVAGVSWVGAYEGGVFQTPPNRVPATALPPVPANLPVLDNTGCDGYVTFTFDDGPDINTMELLAYLHAEHVPAIFFTIGEKVAANPGIVKAEAKYGFLIEDHTWNHQSLTGSSTGTKPLTDAQVKQELTGSINAITSLGLPKPFLWRAPYDDVTEEDNAIAESLGLKLVMSYGDPPVDNIVDSRDWNNTSAEEDAQYIELGEVSNNKTGNISLPTKAELAEATPENGYSVDGGTATLTPGISAGSVLGYHDGLPTAIYTIHSIPMLVNYMNAHHLCATPHVASGNIGLPASDAQTPGGGGGGGGG